MIYQTLARYYDALVYDEDAYKKWLTFVKENATGKNTLELACGSGSLSLILAKEGFIVDAVDLSNDMIEIAKQKDKDHLVNWFIHDMIHFKTDKKYNQILCFCDSLNYCTTKEEVLSIIENVNNHLLPGGVFLFDVHSLNRINEFQEPYCESGVVLGCEYEWNIFYETPYLYQIFAFYQNGIPQLEQHKQMIFQPNDLIDWLKIYDFEICIYTDFINKGIHDGEKYFFVCRKKG